jgi:hypothetical protein
MRFAADNGPHWLANIVNAIGKSAYWNSTAIVVVWDDWGRDVRSHCASTYPFDGNQGRPRGSRF